MSVFVALVYLGILIPYIWLSRERVGPQPLFAVTGDDADMKIASGSFSKPPPEDTTEEEVRLYLEHKRLGNVEKARRLGSLYAEALLRHANELFPEDADPADTPDNRAHHQLLLHSYVINKVIAEYSPNSILAQTTLNCFYEELEAASEKIAAHVKDMAGLSLYILYERTEEKKEDEFGRIYARLCVGEDEEDVAAEGNELYRRTYRASKELFDSVQYAQKT